MTSHRQRNDAPRGNFAGRKRPFRGPFRAHPDASPGEWLWGQHAVEAALSAGRREIRRVVASPERARALAAAHPGLKIETLDSAEIGRILPAGAAHQGVAIKASALEPLSVEEIGTPAQGVLVMLDQITDPQNVGAIFRSAAAFGARGVILQERHAPALSGALAKAAAGATERLNHARVVNLSRALERLADLGWRAVGLDSAAAAPLADVLDGRPTVLVLGSEGEGLRRLVAEHCDTLALIPMPGAFESLNVSAAAAVALYEASRAR